MSEQDDSAAGGFHLDKRVNVALVMTMLVQTASIVWWAATISAAQAQLLVDASRIEIRVERMEGERDDLKTRVIRIEEKIVGQNDTLQQILSNVQTEPRR